MWLYGLLHELLLRCNAVTFDGNVGREAMLGSTLTTLSTLVVEPM
jgi:hypothetical protein